MMLQLFEMLPIYLSINTGLTERAEQNIIQCSLLSHKLAVGRWE